MLTICAFKWGDKYTLDHVGRLRLMLARNLTIPWEMALISDDPDDAHFTSKAGIRHIPLWPEMRDAKLCGVRLRAFGADMAGVIGPRFAWVDLDVVITGNVDHIFGRKEPFVALSTPQGPLAYNGSLVMMDAGARAEVLGKWTPAAYSGLQEHYDRLGMPAGGVSDEGWMTAVLGPDEARINGGWHRRDDGVYFMRKDLAGGRKPLPADARMVIMNGRAFDPSFPAMQRLPWVRQHWR